MSLKNGAADRMKCKLPPNTATHSPPTNPLLHPALGTKYAKIDIDEIGDGPTMLVKGERGRKAMFGGKKKGKKGEAIAPLQNHMVGRRVDGMDAYSHVTALDVKKEEGWWFTLPKWKQR